MENASGLRASSPAVATLPRGACPRCGHAIDALPPVAAFTLGGRAVSRCLRCGTRSTPGELSRDLIFSCSSCGLPFVATGLLPHAEQRCPDCRAGVPPASLPEPDVASATESEVLSALATRWRFVSSPSLSAYLDRLDRQIAGRVEGGTASGRVVLVSEPGLKTLALPSGTLLLTVDMLTFLQDEAELAFVLAHEIAHAASGDAAVRLIRLGFHAVASGSEAPAPGAWAEAALDLVRLGYGRVRERDADMRALESILALRYDPESILRYHSRLGARAERGDPGVSERVAAHPLPSERARRIEKALYGHVERDSVVKVNREVYRRATGPTALATLAEDRSIGAIADRRPVARRAWTPLRVAGVVLAIAAALGVLLGIAVLLGR